MLDVLFTFQSGDIQMNYTILALGEVIKAFTFQSGDIQINHIGIYAGDGKIYIPIW